MAKRVRLLVLVGLGVIFSLRAQAYIELNGFYTGESLSTTSSSSDSRVFFEGALGFTIDKAGHYLAGWGYASFTNNDTFAGSSTTYTSTQMGPRFMYVFDKDKKWSFAAAYYLVTSANFSPSGGGAEEKWKGTAFKLDFGYNFPLSESFFIGLRMNYDSASYTEKFIGSAYTAVSYTKTSIYPSIYSIFYF